MSSVSLLAACGGSAPSPNNARSSDVASVPIATDGRSSELAPRSNCTEPTLPPSPEREKGIDAFLADRPREAVDLLAAVVAKDPRDRAAEAFRAASTAKLGESQRHASEELGSIRAVTLEAIPLAHVTRRTIEAPQAKVQLEKVSETKNLITDFGDWEKKNQLERLGRRRPDDLPASVPPVLGALRLRTAFVHADHTAAIYRGLGPSSSTIVISAEGKKPLVFDGRAAIGQAPRTFDIAFAQLVGSTLLVELAHNGYAKDSGGKNAYLAAFDATTGALAWVSEPLVANAGEVLVSGGSVITGYGFTAEPDFLFVLDLATGKVDQKIPVKSGPEAIRLKGDRLFVRAYDVDYVFKSKSAFAPAPGANLGRETGDAATPASGELAEARCWVRRATAAILAKDANGIREAAERLKPLSHDRTLDELLRLEEKKLSMQGRLDLSSAQLVVVPAPPWQAANLAQRPPPKSSPKLVKLASQAASPVRNMTPAFDPAKPWFIAPVQKGALPEGARADIPSSFGQADLSAIIPDERPAQTDRSILIYGGRFLVLLKGDTTERVFDLEAFRHPPKATPEWKEFAVQNVTYAQERDGVLYLCNGGGSYAKEVYGKKGFLSAIDTATGKLLWRSAPLTCNATFAMTEDHIVSGYGFTAEPDFVFVVRQSDGGVVQKLPVDSGPESITRQGSRVHVETYGHVADFELR